MANRARLLALVGIGSAAALLLPVAIGSTGATFNTTTPVVPSSVTTKQIFPANRAVISHDVRDGSTGSESNVGDPLAVGGDSLTYTSSSWASTFSTTAYIEADFEAPNPGGIPLTAATLNLTFADSRGQAPDYACYYFYTRNSSTGALLGTYGSAAAPILCEGNAVLTATSTSILSSVPTTDAANHLRVRIYFKETKGGWPAKIDLLSLTVTTPYATRTQLAGRVVDQGSVITWPLSTESDAVTQTDAANWPASYTSTKYLKWSFPASVPAGPVVTGATLRHSYHGNSANTLCNYFEVYSGTTLLATHGAAPSTDVSRSQS